MAQRFAVPYEQVLYARPDVEQENREAGGVPSDVRRKPFVTAGESFGTFAPASGPAGPARTIDQLPAHLYRPADAYVYDLPLNRIPFILGAGLSASFALWPTIPQGKKGVVAKLAVVVTAGTLGDLTIYTRVNGSPVQPFPGVVGAIGTLEAPQECGVILAAGDVFDVLAVNGGLAGITVAVRSYGWIWTEG